MGVFFIETVISIILLGGAFLAANTRGILPGTSSYRQRMSLERAQCGLEIDRINRTRTRLKMLESNDVDQMLSLEAGKETQWERS